MIKIEKTADGIEFQFVEDAIVFDTIEEVLAYICTDSNKMCIMAIGEEFVDGDIFALLVNKIVYLSNAISLDDDAKIEAIKFVRKVTGCELKVASRFVELLRKIEK